MSLGYTGAYGAGGAAKGLEILLARRFKEAQEAEAIRQFQQKQAEDERAARASEAIRSGELEESRKYRQAGRDESIRAHKATEEDRDLQRIELGDLRNRQLAASQAQETARALALRTRQTEQDTLTRERDADRRTQQDTITKLVEGGRNARDQTPAPRQPGSLTDVQREIIRVKENADTRIAANTGWGSTNKNAAIRTEAEQRIAELRAMEGGPVPSTGWIDMVTPDGKGTRRVPANQVPLAEKQGFKRK